MGIMSTYPSPEYERDNLIPQRPGVGQMAGRVAVGATRSTFKFVAFILNFFVPGLGTIFIGRIGTAIIQLMLIPVGVLLIPFSGFGFLVLIANWVWSLTTVVQAWRHPGVIYVRERSRR
jgi:TM2 domain-containing membrane protein YozV